MANVLLTPQMITKAAVTLYANTNEFIKNIDKQYSSQYAQAGAKIGDTLNIRLPPDFIVRRGPAASVQDTRETSIPLTLAFQDGVDISFTSADLTLRVQDFARRFLAQMMNNLAGAVAVTIMQASEGAVSNLVYNGTTTILTPTKTTVLTARALMADNSAPDVRRFIVTDQWTNARVTDQLAGLFNPTPEIGQQYRSGRVKNALGFDWFEDQTVIKHTTGSFSAGGTVNGAGQTGSTLTVNAITGTFNKGDIITVAGVNAVNRVNKQTTGLLRQFVVTANVPTGAVSIPIFPAITSSASGLAGGAAVQYQSTDSSPANGAVVALVTPANSAYRKNIAFVKEAVTMGTADLEMPPNVETSRQVLDGVSMRYVRQYAFGTDQTGSRMDVLYGVTWPRGDWGVVVADAV